MTGPQSKDWSNKLSETMVGVKSRSDSGIASLTNLGLADTGIRISINTRFDDIMVDAWGQEIPIDVQWMLADANISMTLVHFDRAVLDVCMALSMGGGSIAIGQVARAGQRLGQGLSRFTIGNNLIGLNLSSPVGNKPWRFWYTYLTGPAVEFPLGTKRSIVTLNWRAIPYTTDPFNGGTGAQGSQLWDYSQDT